MDVKSYFESAINPDSCLETKVSVYFGMVWQSVNVQ